MKIIITLAVVMITSAGSLFAHNPEVVSPRIIAAFNKTFVGATNVKWEIIDSYARASCTVRDQSLFVYFSPDASKVIVTRQLTPDQLPLNLSTQLQKKARGNKLTELFEVLSNGETTYYASVISKTHSTIYKADASGNWDIFKRHRINP